MAKQYDAVVKAIKSAPSLAKVPSSATKAVTKTRPLIEDGYSEMLEPVAVHFRQTEYDRLMKLAEKAGKKQDDTAWMKRLMKLILLQAGKRITLVQGTTKEQVLLLLRGATMKKALEEGWSVRRMARELEPELEKLDPRLGARWRVERITRTEVISAANASTLSGALDAQEDSGLEMEKEWLSTLDGRTRHPPEDKFNHVTPDGQKRPLDKPFNISGEELMFPGDSSLGASAANTVQCRCTIANSIVGL